jgi:alpha-tubulin suppressor-like RCC1 family protein
MAAGATHSIFVKNDGSVWTTGYNPFGELGNGMTTTISTPDSIMNGVVAVAAGGENSLYQKADGSVWASGVNNFGELGTGNTNSVLVPTSVFSGASAISTSGIRSLFLKSGTAWITGSNGVATEALSPDSVLAGVIAVAGSGDFLTSDHVAWFMDVGDVQPSQILYGVSSFSSNSSGCSLFLKTDGTIWAMGQNSYGQCGDGTTNTIAVPKQVSSMAGVVSVIAGGNHSLILTSDHSLYAVGQIDTSYSRNGTFGESLPTLTLVMTNVASAVAGDMYSLVLKQDGSLWAFGLNSSGQFGNGTMTSTVVPVRVNF